MKPFTVFPATLISISYFNIAVKDRHTAISNAFTSVNVLETSTRRFCVVSFTRESETLVLATLEMIAHLVRSVKKPFFRSFRRSFEATKTVSASFFRVKPSSLRRPRVYHTSSDLSRTRHFVHSIETGSDRVVSFTLSSETVVLATSKSIALWPILVKQPIHKKQRSLLALQRALEATLTWLLLGKCLFRNRGPFGYANRDRDQPRSTELARRRRGHQ